MALKLGSQGATLVAVFAGDATQEKFDIRCRWDDSEKYTLVLGQELFCALAFSVAIRQRIIFVPSLL